MRLHTEVSPNAARWPEPLERAYQSPGGAKATELAAKLPHLGLSELLFMSTVMSIPHDARPWGIVKWRRTSTDSRVRVSRYFILNHAPNSYPAVFH